MFKTVYFLHLKANLKFYNQPGLQQLRLGFCLNRTFSFVPRQTGDAHLIKGTESLNTYVQ